MLLIILPGDYLKYVAPCVVDHSIKRLSVGDKTFVVMPLQITLLTFYSCIFSLSVKPYKAIQITLFSFSFFSSSING